MKSMLLAIIIGLLCISMFAAILPQAYAGKVAPGIDVTVTANKESARAGDTVTFSFVVTNTGKATLFGVGVEFWVGASLIGNASYRSGDNRLNGKLESRETWIFTEAYVVTASTPDPASITGKAFGTPRRAQPVFDTTDPYSLDIIQPGESDPLTSPNVENGGAFGYSVAVGDGYIVVGAPWETVGGSDEAGRVYVYNEADTTLAGTLASPNPAAYGGFGYSVAVGDGCIVVGAPWETSTYTGAGNAYIYDLADRSLEGTLTTSNAVDDGGFGWSVAVGDGYIVVGAPWETSTYAAAGKTYVYNSATRTPLSILVAPTPQDYGRFGMSVAVGSGLIVVGAPYEDTLGTSDVSGRVYVYNAANRQYLTTLASPDPVFAGYFGESVAIGSGLIVVGAIGESAGGYADAGRVYLYEADTRNSAGTLTSPDPEAGGFFGNSVAVGDGYIVVGAVDETSGSTSEAGNVYVYGAASKTLVSTLSSPDPETGGSFGYSVAVDSYGIVVGAPGESSMSDYGDGVVYIFI